MTEVSATYWFKNGLPFSDFYATSRRTSLKLELENLWSLSKLTCSCRVIARQARQTCCLAVMQATKSVEFSRRQWRNGRRAGLRNQWATVGVRVPPGAPITNLGK